MTQRLRKRDRLVGLGTWVSVTAAMLWPTLGPLSDDSFPLSTYPMFAAHRGQPILHKLVGIDPRGERRSVPPRLLGTSEVLQAKALIDAAARNKRKRMRLCKSVAERAARDSEYSDVTELQLLRLRYDPIEYFVQGPEPIERRVLARCNVPHEGRAQR